MGNNYSTGCNPPQYPPGCIPPPCPNEYFPPPCPNEYFPPPCPNEYFPPPCPPVCIPAPCPPVCIPAPCPPVCIPAPCPPVCIPAPYPAGAVCVAAYLGTSSGRQLYNPPVPLTTLIQGGMHVGKIIYITGIPKQNCSRFNVNFTCGPHESANIALHFDVRFNFGNDCNVVVRTHRQGGSYGCEERCQNYFPFTLGENFEIRILAEHDSYKIDVNGQYFTEFFHRIHPLNSVTYLNVQGDVVLTQVRFE